MNVDILFGKTTEHLAPLEDTSFLVHSLMLNDFLKLRDEAAKAGFDLQVASAFRDFERQSKIWNAKARGERPLIDAQGNLLEHCTLSATQIMFAILRWSALPGASRHHWGTDIDIYDGNTQSLEEVQLIPSEVEERGPAGPLHSWLDELIQSEASFGFFRPYSNDNGGVSPERWHLSYWPIARRFLEAYTFSTFKRNIESSDLMLKDELLEHSDEIYRNFFLNIDLP